MRIKDGKTKLHHWMIAEGIHKNNPANHHAIIALFVRFLSITERIAMDGLSPLFDRFSPSAKVFYSGSLCIAEDFVKTNGVGYLHLLRSGRLSISSSPSSTLSPTFLTIDQPSVVFYPRPCDHRFQPMEGDSVNLVCATIDLGSEMRNPLIMALPDVLVVPLQDIPAIAPALDLLFAEAFGVGSGRQAALDRLTEYFLILLLRHVIDSKKLSVGILAALNDTRLARAITAMHERPEFPWTLESLAMEAGMSRARFSTRFRETIGLTPLEYLTDWRMSVAQTLLRRGKSLKSVSQSVGYQSPAALRRIFAKKIGVPPGEWLSKLHSVEH